MEMGLPEGVGELGSVSGCVALRGGVVTWWRGGVVTWFGVVALRGGVVAWWRGLAWLSVGVWWRGGVVMWFRGVVA